MIVLAGRFCSRQGCRSQFAGVRTGGAATPRWQLSGWRGKAIRFPVFLERRNPVVSRPRPISTMPSRDPIQRVGQLSPLAAEAADWFVLNVQFEIRPVQVIKLAYKTEVSAFLFREPIYSHIRIHIHPLAYRRHPGSVTYGYSICRYNV